MSLPNKELLSKEELLPNKELLSKEELLLEQCTPSGLIVLPYSIDNLEDDDLPDLIEGDLIEGDLIEDPQQNN